MNFYGIIGSSLSTNHSIPIWDPPEQNCIKWNIDASVLSRESYSAIGGVLRNHSDNFMCLFSSPIMFMEINCAEILAIYRAIKISISCDFSKYEKVIFKSDSSNVVMWSNSDIEGTCMEHVLSLKLHKECAQKEPKHINCP